ncbi:hypothetical protein [Thiocystis violacea]|uniref:hypothetical protein n=1 Tax=Thiocystis violacea TaxID=13725 RepID=UPI001907FF46|nr:hypothetical protein [Thiocystis violacea]MBK1723101.1 hypothetical protein [Thiocystis violacea]
MTANTLHTTKRVTPALLSLLLFGAAPLALAASFPDRIAFAERSATIGLGIDSLALLQRLPGQGAEKTASLLLDRLRGRSPGVFTSERFQREVNAERTSFVSDEGWYLNVYADGTSARYRNYGYLEKMAPLDRPVEERIPAEELEKLGRAFIADYLGDQIRLGRGEELVPYFTEVEVTGGAGAYDGAPMDPELVHSSTVVFTRSINGQPVLGGGSKVAVIFANDGEAVGFDYDWPSYGVSKRVQRILPLDQIRQRGNDYASFKSDDPDVQVRHFECGYVDLGARKRDPAALVQGGCLQQAARKTIVDPALNAKDDKSGYLLSANIDYLPAGEEVQPDAMWEQSLRRVKVKE